MSLDTDIDRSTTDTTGYMKPRSDDEIASASRTDDGQKVCATCGESIDVTERHPVAASVEGEDVNVYLFCSETCRKRWGQQ